MLHTSFLKDMVKRYKGELAKFGVSASVVVDLYRVYDLEDGTVECVLDDGQSIILDESTTVFVTSHDRQQTYTIERYTFEFAKSDRKVIAENVDKNNVISILRSMSDDLSGVVVVDMIAITPARLWLTENDK